MLIGDKNINYGAIKTCVLKGGNLEELCISMVPRIIRHVPAIIDNQKYYVALAIRSMQGIPYKLRKEACESLIKDISLTGICSTFIDFDDLLSQADVDMLADYLLKED